MGTAELQLLLTKRVGAGKRVLGLGHSMCRELKVHKGTQEPEVRGEEGWAGWACR